MMERVENVIASNGLSYKLNENQLTVKLGRIGGLVTIKYDYSNSSYIYSCGEYRLGISSFLFLALAFNTMLQSGQSMLSGYIAGLMFAFAMANLFQIVLMHIQMLDIKVQLRTHDVYLKLSS